MTQKDREKEIEEAIARESRLFEEQQAMKPSLTDIPGVNAKTAERLKEAGLDNLELHSLPPEGRKGGAGQALRHARGRGSGLRREASRARRLRLLRGRMHGWR